MKKYRVRALLALMLIAALALCGCGCGRKAPEKLEVEPGMLRIAEPSATAAPVDEAAVAQTARATDEQG